MVGIHLITPGGGKAAGLKVMKNNADDPVTTPNTDYGKFLFNSETTDIGYINRIASFTYSGIMASSGFYPSGTNASTCQYKVTYYSSSSWLEKEIYFNLNTLGGASYTFYPLCEWRSKKANGRYPGPSNKYSVYSSSGSIDTGFQLSQVGWEMGAGAPVSTNNSGITYSFFKLMGNASSPYTQNGVLSIWELPDRNQPLASPTGTPVAGQQNFLFSPTLIKVVRPGFDVATATGRQVILDSNRVPAKIIRAGQVSIAAGASVTVTTDFALDDTTFVDFNVFAQGYGNAWPSVLGIGPNRDYSVDFEYAISGNSVILYNSGGYTLDVRYMICGDSAAGGTTGGNEWWRVVAGNHWQIKRPGSSDTSPSLSDILFDSRFSYVPIIAEGYLATADFTESVPSGELKYGERAKTISFANTGFVPFVKYVVVHQWIPASGSTETRTRAPRSELLTGYGTSNQWFGRQTNQGTVALISDTSVKFFVSPSNPFRVNYSGQTVTQPNPKTPILGIRYYIFGIPTAL